MEKHTAADNRIYDSVIGQSCGYKICEGGQQVHFMDDLLDVIFIDLEQQI